MHWNQQYRCSVSHSAGVYSSLIVARCERQASEQLSASDFNRSICIRRTVDPVERGRNHPEHKKWKILIHTQTRSFISMIHVGSAENIYHYSNLTVTAAEEMKY